MILAISVVGIALSTSAAASSSLLALVMPSMERVAGMTLAHWIASLVSSSIPTTALAKLVDDVLLNEEARLFNANAGNLLVTDVVIAHG